MPHAGVERMVKLVLLLDRILPFTGPLKRFAYAWRDARMPVRPSYSQHREDLLFSAELRDWRPSEAIYVDVGANHPSRISNTYLLYRRGWHGVVVEPNASLIKLHRRFRPRDVQINVGCGREASLQPFYVSRAPVLSSFSEKDVKYVARAEYLPVLTLDQLLMPFRDQPIALLSIDTEGFDVDVLTGAAESLRRTHLVCVEANDDGKRNAVQALLAGAFEVCATAGCNDVFRRRQGCLGVAASAHKRERVAAA